ncbi:hypothetical protein [Paremcibacter congregatus]|uniref:hypothetical protein n=1 Tax=Paremcibacter congregatus TaxID=2043170 RepID=UPI0030EBF04B
MKIVKYIMAAALLTSVSAVMAVEAAEKAKKDPAQLMRGAKSWAATCGRCHNIRSPKDLTDEEWEVSATHMRVRANLPGDVVRDIVAFLKASNNEKVED